MTLLLDQPTAKDVVPAAAEAFTPETQAIAEAAMARAAQPLPGIEPLDFVRENRIHVQRSVHDAQFVSPTLIIHPRDLAPAREPVLRQKLALAYGLHMPSFHDHQQKNAVAGALAALLPVSLEAEAAKLSKAIIEHNQRVDSGVDATLKKALDDRLAPFNAVVRDTRNEAPKDPMHIDAQKNGLTLYLLLREKLTRLGYLESLPDYVRSTGTPEEVLSDLVPKIGVDALQIRQAALHGGPEAVGQVLGLDTATIASIQQCVARVATANFSEYQIEQWYRGHQRLGPTATFEEKLARGKAELINETIHQQREKAHRSYEVPEATQAEERRIAESLKLVEPVQRALLYALGYEISYSPAGTIDEISGYKRLYGLHSRLFNQVQDLVGNSLIFFAGRGNLKESMRTLVHEIAHNLWPAEFSTEEVQKIDSLLASDKQRFAALKRIMDSEFSTFEKFLTDFQKAGSDAEKAAIAQTTRNHFARHGVSIDAGVLAHLRDANELKYLVAYANDTLTVTGERYDHSRYPEVNARLREVISRFAEVKQVELSGNPQLLQFVAPGINQVWENHYLPHLQRVLQKVQQLPAPEAANAVAATALAPAAPSEASAPTLAPCTADSGTPDTVIDPANALHEMPPSVYAMASR